MEVVGYCDRCHRQCREAVGKDLPPDMVEISGPGGAKAKVLAESLIQLLFKTPMLCAGCQEL